MVGFDPQGRRKDLKWFNHVIAGAISGVISRFFGQPIDVIKIRFQLQTQPISHTSTGRYKSVKQAVRLIYALEGIKTFWKGHLYAQYFSITFGTVQFSSFELYTRFFWYHIPIGLQNEYRFIYHFFCGGIASVTATFVAFPFDVLRTRMIAQHNKSPYKNFFDAIRKMYEADGFHTFYRGITVNSIQVGLQNSLNFSIYQILLDLYKDKFSKEEFLYPHEYFLMASFSGVISKCIIYPLETIKRRMQMQGNFDTSKNTKTLYRNSIQCLLAIANHEGFLALYKGLAPSIMKSFILTGSNFAIFEWITNLMV